MTKKRGQSFERWLCEQQGVLPHTALRHILEAVVPFTEANLKLTFKPNTFFNDLEQIERQKYSRDTLRRAYYEARRKNLIITNDDGSIVLSEDAKRKIVPFVPKMLKGAHVMVVFDVPETESYKRRWLRLLLRELKFVQVQKSVWMSAYDCFELLSAGILEYRLENYVRVFEAREIEA